MVDLSKNRQYVGSYVALRNRHCYELASHEITVATTIDWIRGGYGDIFCEVENGAVVAAVIVYRHREVAVFSEKPRLGDTLLAVAEACARDRGYAHLWAWARLDNERPIKMFLRNGYEKKGCEFHKDIAAVDLPCYGMKPGAEDFPLMVVLSFVYVCNAQCPNCPYNNSTIRNTYRDALWMEPELFKKIADECGPHGAVLRLSGGGEPFLHKHIAELTRYATDKGCKVSIITNGSIDVRDVLGVADMVEFSVDAGTEDEYAMARPGLSWQKLNANVAEAIANKGTTTLICSIIKQKGIDVERAQDYWKSVGKVQVRKFLTWGYNEDRSADASPYMGDNDPCPWLFERMNIDSRGAVTYCGEDIAFAHKFADVNTRSIAEIWKGPEFWAIRAAHLAKQGHPEMCVNCPDWKFRTWERGYFKLREDARSNIAA